MNASKVARGSGRVPRPAWAGRPPLAQGHSLGTSPVRPGRRAPPSLYLDRSFAVMPCTAAAVGYCAPCRSLPVRRLAARPSQAPVGPLPIPDRSRFLPGWRAQVAQRLAALSRPEACLGRAGHGPGRSHSLRFRVKPSAAAALGLSPPAVRVAAPPDRRAGPQ